MAALVNKKNREVKVIIPNMREFTTFYSDNDGVIGMLFKRDWEEEKQEEHWKPSEEDEAHRAFILESLEDQIRFCKKDAEGAYYAKQIRTAQDWLKSLKPRWKPSEEQIKAIRLARSFVVDDFDEHPTLSEILMELEEQLKKLM